MNKKIYMVCIVIFLNLISFKIGLHYGIYQMSLVDSPYKAFIYTVQLKNIEMEKYDAIKVFYKSRLINEMINFGKYIDHGKPWLFLPYHTGGNSDYTLNIAQQDKYIKKAITYIRENKIKMPYDLSLCDDDNKDKDYCRIILKKQFFLDKAISSEQEK